MFGQPSSSSYFDTTPSAPHHTSVIVQASIGGDGVVSAATPSGAPSPMPPYYSNPNTPYPYSFPLILGSEWPFQFQSQDANSPGLQSPLANSPFAQLPLPTTPFYNSSNRTAFPDFYVTPQSMVQYTNNSGSLKKSVGRKPKTEVDMDDEDEDKRLKRRQRNKEAAARCRQRRLDLMNELQQQVTHLRVENDRKNRKIADINRQLMMFQNYLQEHDCKLSTAERMQQVQPMPTIQMPPRVESTAHSTVSNVSSSSSSASTSSSSSVVSDPGSPADEDYKPSMDHLKSLPPISSISKPDMPPPPLPATSKCSTPSIVVSRIPARTENGFLEPEIKIPKIESDRTLASLVSSVERPSALPMMSATSIATEISTPSRPFRAAPNAQQNGEEPVDYYRKWDFLSTNTGLTPNGIPAMNFVSTPTPLPQPSESDLRPL